jgi:iron complex outermembrane receptor protein
VNISGNTKPYAPEFTFNAGIQYAFALGPNMTLTPRVDYAHIGESWTTIFNNTAQGDLLSERDIVNASIKLNTGDWTWTAYAINAADETYIAAINSGLRYAGPPRQYGINLTKTF